MVRNGLFVIFLLRINYTIHFVKKKIEKWGHILSNSYHVIKLLFNDFLSSLLSFKFIF